MLMFNKQSKKIYFFTFNNFLKDDGGTIRMKGIMNALAEKGIIVTLISNCTLVDQFDKKINHIFLNYFVSKQEKRSFQLLLSFLPFFISFAILLAFFDEIIASNIIISSLVILQSGLLAICLYRTTANTKNSIWRAPAN